MEKEDNDGEGQTTRLPFSSAVAHQLPAPAMDD